MPASSKQRLSASLEDYIEAIYNLTLDSSVARSKDIAGSLGVSKASVTQALRVLKDKGLANYKPYDFVTLTEAGKTAAAEIVERHNVLRSFFVNVLGIDDKTAQRAACRAEHSLGPKVISKLLFFVEFATASRQQGVDFARQFAKFCRERSKYDTTRKRTARKRPRASQADGSAVPASRRDNGKGHSH